jgi:hypothetical protein
MIYIRPYIRVHPMVGTQMVCGHFRHWPLPPVYKVRRRA